MTAATVLQTPVKPSGKKFRFNLRGVHNERVVTGKREITLSNGEKAEEDVIEDRTFRNCIIESDRDLHSLYDQPGVAPKYEPLQDTTPSTVEGIDAEIARLEAARKAIVSGKNPEAVLNDNSNQTSATTSVTAVPEKTPVQRAAESGFDPNRSNKPNQTANYRATLEVMDIAELRNLAAQDEIDLKGARKKEDIIEVLLAAASS